jgi:hypothetical protein
LKSTSIIEIENQPIAPKEKSPVKERTSLFKREKENLMIENPDTIVMYQTLDVPRRVLDESVPS